jgi:hypothetical protein
MKMWFLGVGKKVESWPDQCPADKGCSRGARGHATSATHLQLYGCC